PRSAELRTLPCRRWIRLPWTSSWSSPFARSGRVRVNGIDTVAQLAIRAAGQRPERHRLQSRRDVREGPELKSPRGAYGLRITGLDGAEHLLVRADPGWPRLDVRVEARPASPDEAGMVDDEQAVIPLHDGGTLVVERDSGRAVFRLPVAPEDGALVHPYLSPAAAVMARWHG